MNVNFKQLSKTLHKISKDTLKVMEKSVVKFGDTYVVFGIYNIIDKDGNFEILKNGDYVDTVGHISTALSWCIANDSGNFMLQKHLLDYDRILGNRLFDIRNYNKLLKSDIEVEQKEIIQLKLSHDIRRYNDAKYQLQNYIKKAKYIKTKGLANETTKSII